MGITISESLTPNWKIRRILVDELALNYKIKV